MSEIYSWILLTLFLKAIEGQLPPQKCVFDPRAFKTPKCDCSCRDGKDGRDGRDGRDGFAMYAGSSDNNSPNASGKIFALENELKALQKKVKDLEATMSNLNKLEQDVLDFRAARMSKDNDGKGSGMKEKYMKAYKKEQEMLELRKEILPTKKPATEAPTLPDLLANLHGSSPLRINGNGKLSRKLLPAGFDKMSLADVQWQSLHMSAASACRGISKSGGHPGMHNVVLLRNAKEGKTCRQLCSKSWADKCEGEVSIWGKPGKGKKNGQEIGNFYNYGCDYGNGGGNEADVKPDAILQDMAEAHQYFFSYCCCSFY